MIISKLAIVIPLTWTIAQGLKVLTSKQTDTKVTLFSNGGMPSSHSATVCALTTGILINEGISNLFMASFVFALIVMRDATGVRQETGKLAKYINKLINLTGKSKRNERTGHTPLEVFAGATLGIIISLIAYLAF